MPMVTPPRKQLGCTAKKENMSTSTSLVTVLDRWKNTWVYFSRFFFVFESVCSPSRTGRAKCVKISFSYNLNQRNDVCLITTNADKAVDQSELVAETCIRRQARENMRLLLRAGKWSNASEWSHLLCRDLYTFFLLSKCNSQLKIATFAWIRRIFLKIVRMFRDKQENWIAFVHVSSVPGGSLAKPCYGRHALHSQTRAFRSCCVLWREATWPVAVWLPSPGRPVWNSNLVDHRSCTSFWKAGRRIRECTKGLLQETGTSLCKNTALVFSLHL